MQTNSKYKNIIFDLGGVLINWNPKKIITDIFKDKECMPFEMWSEFFKLEYWQNLDRGTTTKLQVLNLLPEKFDKKQVNYFFKKMPEQLFPLKSGLEILDAIKALGYKTYVLSNFEQEAFEQVESKYTFLNKFDGAIFSYKVKFVKPESQIYKILLDTYSINPAESLFIDDLQANIEGAKHLGIDGIVCKNHDYVWQELKKLGVIPTIPKEILEKEKNL